jgi:hypothetical protein
MFLLGYCWNYSQGYSSTRDVAATLASIGAPTVGALATTWTLSICVLLLGLLSGLLQKPLLVGSHNTLVAHSHTVK